MDFLLHWLSQFTSWLINFVVWGLERVFHVVMVALTAVIASIPVPGFLSSAPTIIGSIPSSVAFFLQVFQVPSGLSIIITAYLLRFFIRRLPIVG